MTHTVSLTVTAEGAEDVAKLLEALKIAGLEKVSKPKSRKQIEQEENPFDDGLNLEELPGKPVANKLKTPKEKKGRPGRPTKLTDSVKEYLRNLATEGKTIRDASDLTDIPYSSIYQWARKNGVSFEKGTKGRPLKGDL